jgi:hypothetical protein
MALSRIAKSAADPDGSGECAIVGKNASTLIQKKYAELDTTNMA